MKLHISSSDYQSLQSKMGPLQLYGTINLENEVATITSLSHDGQITSSDTRMILAAVPDCHITPFKLCFDGDLPQIYNRDGQCVEIVVYQKSDFSKRTPFDPDIVKHLNNKTVMIIGLGSVAAEVAVGLGKAGTGSIVGLDNDKTEIHNCFRHVLGQAYVGWPKPIALQHFFKENVPTSTFIPVSDDMFLGSRESLRELMETYKPTHIIAATDVLKIQYLGQRLAVEYGLPFMAVWCDNNAVEGEIFMWEPGQASGWKPGRPQRGCYACMRNPDEVTITRSSHFDYSNDDPDSYGGEPALGCFINRINNITTIFMLAWMLRDYSKPTKLAGILDEFYDNKGLQYIRLGGPYPMDIPNQITAKKPWAVEWYRVLKQSNCTYCGDRLQNRLILFPENKQESSYTTSWDDCKQL